MPRIRPWIAIPMAALAAILTGCTANQQAATVPVAEPIEARTPDVEKAIHDQKGKVVLVDCWATWCPPCVKRFPHLVETQKAYADKGLVCMGVCMDKYKDPEDYSKDKVFKFLKDKKAAFPNLIVIDPEADSTALKKLLGDYSTIPFMALFDRNGRRVWTSDERPRLTDDELDGKIESLLAEKP
jgi:thiol-disulfide isomerase/thioredoxin